MSKAIQPVCLPPNSSYRPKSDIPAWIAGWGALSYQGKSAIVLQNVKITYYRWGADKCSRYTVSDWNRKICAGDYEGGKDSCQGDSGGPLYVKEKDSLVLAGLVSYGTECGKKYYPG